MPEIKSTRHRTPLEELIDIKLQHATGVGFLELIAFYRQPGENFRKWEWISRRILQLTDRWITRPSIRTWAAAAGIPETDDPGTRGTVEDTLAFRKTVGELGVIVPLEEPEAKRKDG